MKNDKYGKCQIRRHDGDNDSYITVDDGDYDDDSMLLWPDLSFKAMYLSIRFRY